MSIKYHFFPIESKIYDFLHFPNMIYVKSEHFDEKGNYAEVIDDTFKSFCYNLKAILTPYNKEIKMFYTEDFSIFDKLSSLHQFFYKTDIEDYLTYLLSLNAFEITKGILYSLLLLEQNKGYNETTLKNAERLAKDKNAVLEYIKNLSFEGEVKWNLFCMIENPTNYVNDYVTLMHKLHPLFETIYKDYEEKVKTCGESLILDLNKEVSKGLGELTSNILQEEMIDSKEINFIVSAINPYAIAIVPTGMKPYVSWGLKAKEAFDKIKLLNENKLNERVLLFKNLGDKTRYEVLKLIANGITSTKEIAELLGVSSATISYHLSNLMTSKLILIDKTNTQYTHLINYDYLERCMKDLKEDVLFPLD